MASNSFGNIFRITTWGESHGVAIGVVIDGCPAGVELSDKDINDDLQTRKGGRCKYTTPRKEPDIARIYSGVFKGVTTGAPISIVIYNKDIQSKPYEDQKYLLSPGHASYTYLKKYGIFDYRGSGRASARETACRVAAGSVAKKVLSSSNISFLTYVHSIGHHTIKKIDRKYLSESILQCPDKVAEKLMVEQLDKTIANRDSMGGTIECQILNVPEGIGDPVYEKIESKLAQAMLSIPASKGFEIGSGFASSGLEGSLSNDLFDYTENGSITCLSNNAGGVLGGISTGMPIIFRVPFKPTSSIGKNQYTVNYAQKKRVLKKAKKQSRHDPCLAIRAVPVVESMAALALVDAFLLSKVENYSEREKLTLERSSFIR